MSPYFSFEYRRSDVTGAYRLHYLRLLSGPVIYGQMFVGVLLLAFALWQPEELLSPLFLVAGLLFLLFPPLFWQAMPQYVWYKEQGFRLPVRFAFDRRYFYLRSAGSDSSLRWSVFRFYLESSRFYLIYRDNQHFFIIPKSALPADQQSELSALLAALFSGHKPIPAEFVPPFMQKKEEENRN